MAFSSNKANILGNKIRTLRESLGLTREDVANSIPYLSVQTLQHIEDSVDSIANPSLIQLRQIATVLKTTVAELVEPDLGGLLISTLEDWMTGSGRTAARFNGVSIKDRNRLLRRMLLRMIDSLEKEE
jgi:transcriptional regulator with XRE-family HTH domain